ncbi:MAG: phosphoesterase family-domain-containing protein [Piptocephalis tieghemiana]|nr:MAG: phosphoesterase family-domain-containing protein [Piptocephalis tieghemiana]
MNPKEVKVKGKWFDRIVIINLENTDYADAIVDPYLAQLARKGTLLSKYSAITHPSQPNYIAQIYGDVAGVTDDSLYNVPGKSLADLLEAKGIPWKSYQEQYPEGAACYAEERTADALYQRKHNPWISMNNVRKNPEWCARIVPATRLDQDIDTGDVPQVVYYTPDMNNDGHDTSVPYMSAWLESFLTPKLTLPAFTRRTLIVVTYDEREVYAGWNHVYTVLLGPAAKALAGYEDPNPYDHYSLLRTIEENWSLGTLGRGDAKATPFILDHLPPNAIARGAKSQGDSANAWEWYGR